MSIESNSKSEGTIVTVLKSEVTFWIMIIGIVVSSVTSFSALTARVLANEVEIKENKDILIEIDKKVDNVLVKQAEMQKDIEYIIKK